MKKHWIKLAVMGLVYGLTLSVFYQPIWGGNEDGDKLQFAPINPAFIAGLNQERERFTSEGYPLGYAPSPVDLSHVRAADSDMIRSRSYPASYDLRTLSRLTAVRDQGDCGSCWTFGTFASLESYLKPTETRDFSEQDLNANHGFDWAECDGGNAFMSQAYLARWSGPVSESDEPYPYAVDVPQSGASQQKHVQQVVYLPARSSYTDNDTVKYFVTQYGAVYFSFYWSSSYYNQGNCAYYNSANTSANHAVAIVGWDDNYSKNNFNVAPAGNGAFIVRNSWGSSWGNGGYFYISYYDRSLQELVSFNNAEAANNYDGVYQYDPLGWVTDYGYSGTTAWAANIFTASSAQYLSAVGLITNDVNTNYTVYVYRGVSGGAPRSGTLVATKTGANPYPGYYTVALDTPLALSGGQTFSIVVKYTNSSYTYPIPVETKTSNYSSAASANAGESYVSSGGSSWYDLSNYNSSNATIKAFYSLGSSALSLTAPTAASSWSLGSSQTISWTKSGSMNEYVKLRLYNSTGTTVMAVIADNVANSGTYTWTIPAGLAVGNYLVRVKTVDNLVYDDSPVFAITQAGPTITVTAPATGTTWNKGATRTIGWTKSGTMNAYVKLRLYNSAGTAVAAVIADNVANSGTYSWTVPAGLAVGNYLVRVKTVDNQVYDDSTVFTIAEAGPTIEVTAPTAVSSWKKGSVQTITWTKSGTMNAYVKLRLYNSAGTVVVSVIADNVANSGTYNWTVPAGLAAGSYIVRIKTVDNLVYDDSPVFTIQNP